jgi:hypothetical protein
MVQHVLFGLGLAEPEGIDKASLAGLHPDFPLGVFGVWRSGRIEGLQDFYKLPGEEVP